MSAPAPITRDGAARAARHELSKPIYHRDQDSLPVRVMHAIGRFIDHLLSSAFKHAPGGGLGALLLVAVVAAAVGVIIWRVGLPARNAASQQLLLSGAPVQSAAEHRARSMSAADRRDWNTAVVERMRAVARELEERGVLDPRPGRTATELAADASTRLPAIASALAVAARTFNAVAYGGVAGDAADLTAVAEADQAVISNSARLVQV
ncbi:MAG TPA: DUF4129 domain-containing protein [Mycobacteriales bacterium]|nr:DUF4129 domain-containing protein [Mycobacteriales bacterium]